MPEGMWQRMARDALVGFAASTVSDIVANPLRVLKTMKQSYGIDTASPESLSYKEALQIVMDGPGGIMSLFQRGLFARMITNGVQSMIFTVLLGMQTAKEEERERNDTDVEADADERELVTEKPETVDDVPVG